MSTTTFTVTRTLKVVKIVIDIVAATMTVSIAFLDASNANHGTRDFKFDTSNNVTDESGNALPASANSLKFSITGGGANSGLIAELNSYISTNANSFVQ